MEVDSGGWPERNRQIVLEREARVAFRVRELTA